MAQTKVKSNHVAITVTMLVKPLRVAEVLAQTRLFLSGQNINGTVEAPEHAFIVNE